MGSWVFYAADDDNGVFNSGLRFVTYDISAAVARQTSLSDEALIVPNQSQGSYNIFNVGNEAIYLYSAYSNGNNYYYSVAQFLFGNLSDSANYVDTGSYYSVSAQSIAPGYVFKFGSNIFVIDYDYNYLYYRYLKRLYEGSLTNIDSLENLIDGREFLAIAVRSGEIDIITEESVDVGNGDITLTYYKSINGFVWTGPHTRLLDFAYGDVAGSHNVVISGDNADQWVVPQLGLAPGTSRLFFSDDAGATWSSIPNIPAALDSLDPNNVPVVLDILGSRIICLRENILYTTIDGSSWTTAEPFVGSQIQDVAFDGTSTYMVVGDDGQAATTTDFVTFTSFAGFDFEYQNIYRVLYTTQEGNLIGTFEATISATTNSDTVSIQSTVNSADGVIQGTLKLDNASGSFAARPVILYTYPGGVKVAETTSDGTTGAWEFTQVSPGDYFVVGLPSAEDSETYNRDFDADGIITVA